MPELKFRIEHIGRGIIEISTGLYDPDHFNMFVNHLRENEGVEHMLKSNSAKVAVDGHSIGRVCGMVRNFKELYGDFIIAEKLQLSRKARRIAIKNWLYDMQQFNVSAEDARASVADSIMQMRRWKRAGELLTHDGEDFRAISDQASAFGSRWIYGY